MEHNEEEQDLYNYVLAGCSAPHRAFADMSAVWKAKQHKSKRKEVIRMVRQNRVDLIGAQKFVIADSLLEHACWASVQSPEAMLDMAATAIPPFDNMWIECDDQKRWKHSSNALKQLNIKGNHDWDDLNKTGRVGWHIQKMTEGAPCAMAQYKPSGYIASCYFTVTDPSMLHSKANIGTVPMVVNFNCDEELDFSDLEKRLVIQSNDGSFDQEKADEITRAVCDGVLGKGYCDHYKKEMDSHLGHELSRRCNIIVNDGISGAAAYVVLSNRDTEAKHIDAMSRFMESTIAAVNGDIRFLWATLALLNYPHNIIERDIVQSKVHRLAYGQRVPRNELRLLDIDLPKPKGTTQYERMFAGSGAKKRRHVRRGHFRNVVLKDGTEIRRWIKEQWVGDAKLGTITHDYNLKSKIGVEDNNEPNTRTKRTNKRINRGTK